MSDGSRQQLYAMKESSWGDIPATALSAIRYNSENLNYNVQTESSMEIRSDRQTADITRVGAQAEGSFEFEWSYGAHDLFLEGLLNSAWTTPLTISSTAIDASATDDSFNGAGLFGDAVVGQWVKVAGFATEANNGYFRILTATANKITVDATLVTEAVGPTVTITGTNIQNGTTPASYTLEKAMTDITQFIVFTGMVPGTLEMRVEARARLTGTLGFMGRAAQIQQTTAGTGAAIAAPTNQVLNATSHVGFIRALGTTFGTGVYARSLNLSLTNNLRARDAIGSLPPISIGQGTFEATGNVTAYFVNETLYEAFLNDTAGDISVRFTDDAGNALLFTLYNVKFSNGVVVNQGKDNDIMASMDFTALYDPATGKTFGIDKIAA